MSIVSAINTLFNHAGLRRFLVHSRLPLGAAALAVLLSLVRPSPWFWRGLAISLVGALAQGWCFACIMTSQELAVNGPYRFVRNPMYLARYTLLLGLLLMPDPTRPWRGLLPLVFTIVYLFFMHNRVRREERKLGPIFGAPYARYLESVPRLIPTWRAYPGGKTLHWNAAAFRRNHGARNLTVVLGGYLLAYLVVYHLKPWIGGM